MSKSSEIFDFDSKSLFQNNGGNQIAGVKVLNPATMGVGVIYREREQKEIYDEIVSGKNGTNLIYGSSGSGKSVVSREAAKRVVDERGGKLFDGRKVYSKDGNDQIHIYYIPFLSSQPEGLSEYISSRKLEDYDGNIKYVVFIDQLDMRVGDEESPDDVNDVFDFVKRSLNNPKIFGISLKHLNYDFGNELHFEPYNNKEIIGILSDKAGISFQSGVLDPRIIYSCADITKERFSSNISTAMNLLKSTGSIAQINKSETVTLEHFKEATNLKLRSHKEEIIKRLPADWKSVLDATNYSIQNNGTDMGMDDVYKRYSDVGGSLEFIEFAKILTELDKQSLHDGCRTVRENGSVKVRSIITFPEKEYDDYMDLTKLCK